MDEIKVLARVDNLSSVIDFIENKLLNYNCNDKEKIKLLISVEEIYVNVARYAYKNKDGFITVKCGLNIKESRIYIQFIDNGRKYNPLLNSDPNINLKLDERKEGGLGIFMVKKNVDKIYYDFKDGNNILTIIKEIDYYKNT